MTRSKSNLWGFEKICVANITSSTTSLLNFLTCLESIFGYKKGEGEVVKHLKVYDTCCKSQLKGQHRNMRSKMQVCNAIKST